MDTILQILGDLTYARVSFVRRQPPPGHYHRFFENEGQYLALVREMIRWQNAREEARAIDTIRTFLVSGVAGQGRPGFWEDVPLPPTRQQIEHSTRIIAPPTGESCSICMTAMTPQTVHTLGSQTMLPCNHSFHRNCLDQWWRQSARCPVCRNDIRQSNSQPNNNVRVRNDTHTQSATPVVPVANVSPAADDSEGEDSMDHTR
jgi:hypothetical protein